MPAKPTRKEIEDFIHAGLVDGLGYGRPSIRAEQALAIDLGVSGALAHDLLLTLHQRFGTDFSELDADAGFGAEDRTPGAAAVSLYCLVEWMLLWALHRLKVVDDRAFPPRAVDDRRDAWVTVGGLVEAVERGAWVGRPGPRPAARGTRPPPERHPGRPIASLLGVMHRISSRAIAIRTRQRITWPCALPSRVLRVPHCGFRREQAIRCAWCGRRELVWLDHRFGDYDLTCLACHRDSTLRRWSRAYAELTGWLGFNPPLLLIGMLAVPMLLVPGANLLTVPAAVGLSLFLISGRGHTRRLPDGAEPQPPGPI